MLYGLAQGKTLDDVLEIITRGRQVYALEKTEDGQYHFVRAEAWDPEKHTLGTFRPVEPLKSLFFRPREFLGSIKEPSLPSVPERIVLGAKNCDLSGLKVQDYVFQDEAPVDPLYAEARDKTVLVSCDCTGCLEVCFCPAMGEQPHPKEGFDINISRTSKGDLLETGSEWGEKALEAAREYLEPAGDEMQALREQERAAMYQRVADQAAQKGLESGMDWQKAVQESGESKLWEDFAADCVECGACNFACCTCHCFFLADGVSRGGLPSRAKQWDSCLLKNFARVAGDANPRAARAARLRNRFEKKFTFFPEVMDRYACDGCGRCIEACIGKIDIRAVLKRAADET